MHLKIRTISFASKPKGKRYYALWTFKKAHGAEISLVKGIILRRGRATRGSKGKAGNVCLHGGCMGDEGKLAFAHCIPLGIHHSIRIYPSPWSQGRKKGVAQKKTLEMRGENMNYCSRSLHNHIFLSFLWLYLVPSSMQVAGGGTSPLPHQSSPLGRQLMDWIILIDSWKSNRAKHLQWSYLAYVIDIVLFRQSVWWLFKAVLDPLRCVGRKMLWRLERWITKHGTIPWKFLPIWSLRRVGMPFNMNRKARERERRYIKDRCMGPGSMVLQVSIVTMSQTEGCRVDLVQLAPSPPGLTRCCIPPILPLIPIIPLFSPKSTFRASSSKTRYHKLPRFNKCWNSQEKEYIQNIHIHTHLRIFRIRKWQNTNKAMAYRVS